MPEIYISTGLLKEMSGAKDLFAENSPDTAERVSSMISHVSRVWKSLKHSSPERAIDRLTLLACMAAAWAGEVASYPASYYFDLVILAIIERVNSLEENEVTLGGKWPAELAQSISHAGLIDPESGPLLCMSLVNVAARAIVWAAQIREEMEAFPLRAVPVTLSFGGSSPGGCGTVSGGSGGNIARAGGGASVSASSSGTGGGVAAGGSAGGGGEAIARPVPPVAPWVLEPYLPSNDVVAGSLRSRLEVLAGDLDEQSRAAHRLGAYGVSSALWGAHLKLRRELGRREQPGLLISSATAFGDAMSPLWQEIEQQQRAWAASMGRVLHESLINGFACVTMRPGDVLSRAEGGSYMISSEVAREITIHWTMTEEEYDQLWAALEHGTAWSPYLRRLKAEHKMPGPADPATTMLLTADQVMDKYAPGRSRVINEKPELCGNVARHEQHPHRRQRDGVPVWCPGFPDAPALQQNRFMLLMSFSDEGAMQNFSSWWITLGRDLWGRRNKPFGRPMAQSHLDFLQMISRGPFESEFGSK